MPTKYIKDLSLGTQVHSSGAKDINGNNITWTVLAKEHTNYPANSVTLISSAAVAEIPFDAKESMQGDNRSNFGNSSWRFSNIRTWLNSDKYSWYSAAHSKDAAPIADFVQYGTNAYASKGGFLSSWSTDFKNILLPTTLTTADKDTGGTYNTSDKVFLMSNDLNNEFLQAVSIAQDTDFGWTRTPDTNYEVKYIDDGTRMPGILAYSSQKVRPMINVDENTRVLDNGDGTYNITFNSLPLISGSNTNLSYQGKAFSFNYSVNDEEGNPIDLNITLDGNTSLYQETNFPQNTTKTFTISDTTFNNLTTGTHTVSVKANDALAGESIRTYTFTKSSNYPFIDIPYFAHYGDLNKPFSINYTIGNLNGGNLRLKIDIDGVTKYDQSGLASPTTQQFTMSQNDWTSLTIGEHTATFTVTNSLSYSYTRSVKFNRVNTNLVINSDTGTEIGKIINPLAVNYKLYDTGNLNSEVSVWIDGKKIEDLGTKYPGVDYYYTIPSDKWVELSLGQHNLTLKATDTNNATANKTFNFTRTDNKILFELAKPIETSDFIQNITFGMDVYSPKGSSLKMLVTNNAFDEEPVWEDFTEAFLAEETYLMQNKTKTSTKWGLNIKVELLKGTSSEVCWIKYFGLTYK